MMTIHRSLFFLFLYATIFLPALSEHQSSSESFLSANELYKKGDYTQALEHYRHIAHKSPHVFYNMGNCAYKLNKLGYALLYWRKAEHNWGLFGRDELLNNIALVRKQLTQEKAEKKISSIKKISESLSVRTTSFIKALPLLWFQLAVLLLWLFLFLYLRYLHKRGKMLVIALLFCFQAASAGMLVLKYSINLRRYGVVISKQAILRAGPGDTYKILGELAQGDEVLITKQSDNFYKITTHGTIAWVSEKELEQI